MVNFGSPIGQKRISSKAEHLASEVCDVLRAADRTTGSAVSEGPQAPLDRGEPIEGSVPRHVDEHNGRWKLNSGRPAAFAAGDPPKQLQWKEIFRQ